MRRTAGAAMLGLISAGLSAGATVSAATPGAGAPVAAATSQHCPTAESLVPRADWHHHRLGPGVTLAESRVHDRQGVVSMHVVRASLPHRAVSVRPLMHQLTRRLPLTLLAAGHRHLVAA